MQTQKRTDKEQEHELGRLVKVKIELQNKLASLKREMASQLDKDPALAALVAGCEIQRSARTSESGADEASSMGEFSISSFISMVRTATNYSKRSVVRGRTVRVTC